MTQFSVGVQLVFNTEQGLPIAADWLFFNRINVRARQGLRLGPVRCIARLVDYHDRFLFECILHLSLQHSSSYFMMCFYVNFTFCETTTWLMGGEVFCVYELTVCAWLVLIVFQEVLYLGTWHPTRLFLLGVPIVSEATMRGLWVQAAHVSLPVAKSPFHLYASPSCLR